MQKVSQAAERKWRDRYPGEPKAILARLAWHFQRKRKKMARKSTLKILAKVNSLLALSWLDRLQMKWFLSRQTQVKLLPVVGYSELASRTLTIGEAASAICEPPRLPNEPAKSVETEAFAMQAYMFDDAVVMANSSAISVGDTIGVPQFYTRNARALIADPHKLLWHSADGLGLVDASEPVSQVEGLMLFSHGAANWYHWLVENLPAAYFSLQLPDGLNRLPLIISTDVAEATNFRESLDLFRDNREIVVLSPGHHRFHRLVAIDSLVREPMNMRHGLWPEIKDYFFFRQQMQDYRSAILSRLGIESKSRRDRLFLARGNGRRTYNQAELINIAERNGFRAVYPETLNFREQVELFSGASHIVGPSGAAFANSLFCMPNTRLLSWLPSQYKNFCSYTNIANATQNKLRYIYAQPDQPIQSSFDAFKASYSIEPKSFEDALRSVLEDEGY